MGLEAVTGIWDFNTSWPLPTDKRRQGDDHLRNIKLGTKNTFPNINAPVTATDEILNSIPANLGAIITEILEHLEPAGFIKMWHLAHGAVPAGWSLCDGSIVVGYGATPDMRNRFIVGAGSDYAADTVGGADSRTSGNGGAHTPAIQGTALTAAQIPAHDHRLYTWETGASSDANNFATVNSKGIAGNSAGTFAYRASTTEPNKLVENTGAAASTHTHTADAVADHTHSVDVRPRYYVTVFVVKTTSYVAP
jgi:microcystin-dependent protein